MFPLNNYDINNVQQTIEQQYASFSIFRINTSRIAIKNQSYQFNWSSQIEEASMKACGRHNGRSH